MFVQTEKPKKQKTAKEDDKEMERHLKFALTIRGGCYDIYGFQALFDILANRLRQLRTGSGSGSVDADGNALLWKKKKA